LPLEKVASDKKGIGVSRTLSQDTSSFEELHETVSARAVEKLRDQASVCGHI
jgi:nucleotidyltransferase/DNA polymerase involved in DNA repair